MHSSILTVHFSKIVFAISVGMRELKNLSVVLMICCVVINC